MPRSPGTRPEPVGSPPVRSGGRAGLPRTFAIAFLPKPALHPRCTRLALHVRLAERLNPLHTTRNRIAEGAGEAPRVSSNNHGFLPGVGGQSTKRFLAPVLKNQGSRL